MPSVRRAPRAIVAGLAIALAAAAAEPQAEPPVATAPEPSAPPDLDARARRAAERGLAWLLAEQRPNGAWLCDAGFKLDETFEVTTTIDVMAELGSGHLGVTALAGLALLEGRDGAASAARAAAIERATAFVLSCAREDGSLFDGHSDLHGNAFAVEFLARGLLLAPGREDVKAALDAAVEATIAERSQLGGWDYKAFTFGSDAIVTGVTLRALHAAARAGVAVEAAVFDGAARHLESLRIVTGRELGGYKYKPVASYRTRSSPTITALAVESLVAGRRLSGARLAESLDCIERGYSERNASPLYANHFFGTTDALFAARALRAARDAGRTAFADRIRENVLARQTRFGSWTDNVGDAFATAAAVLTLVGRD